MYKRQRLGNLETNSPLYFRNQPVGCTATIIYQMYGEQGVEITPEIAGILCSAILSDTLMFRSPTCTPLDESAARALAKIAGVEVEKLATEMFEAGENLTGKTASEVFLQDFKVDVYKRQTFCSVWATLPPAAMLVSWSTMPTSPSTARRSTFLLTR